MTAPGVRESGAGATAMLIAALITVPGSGACQAAGLEVASFGGPSDTAATLHLTRVRVITTGELASAGIKAVTGARIDERGRIIVVDGIAGVAVRFDRGATRIPLEPAARPWSAAILPGDSLILLDVAGRKIEIFTDHLEPAGRVQLPPRIIPTAIHASEASQILIVGSATAGGPAAMVVDRHGRIRQDVGPVLRRLGFTGPVGGVWAADQWVFASGDASRIRTVRSGNGATGSRLCERGALSKQNRTGEDPAQVRQRSVRLVSLGGDTLLHTIRDLVANNYVTEIFTTACELLSRRVIDVPLTFVDAAPGRLVGVLTVQGPEIVIYSAAPVR